MNSQDEKACGTHRTVARTKIQGREVGRLKCEWLDSRALTVLRAEATETSSQGVVPLASTERAARKPRLHCEPNLGISSACGVPLPAHGVGFPPLPHCLSPHQVTCLTRGRG